MINDGPLSIFEDLKLTIRNIRKLNLAEKTMRNLMRSGQVEIGLGTYGLPLIYTWNPETRLIIGKFCSIAADVRIILGGEHRLDWVSTYPFTEFLEDWPEARKITGHPSSKGDINIGNDVWIGNGCTILSGVVIGDGAVIAAGSVVTRNVEPYSIVGGIPAERIKNRFPPLILEELMRIKWWNLPEKEIRRLIPILLAEPSLDFLKKIPASDSRVI